MSPSTQLLVYRFASNAGFENRLVGALERVEVGGALRVLDVLFVSSDCATGEIFALELRGGSSGGLVAPLPAFRLDVDGRRRITRRASASGHADLIAGLGEALEPGDALVAVLVGHEWARALDDAVARTGGTELVNSFVAGRSLMTMVPELVEAAGSAGAR
jgi:hypothetical protein